MSSMNRRDFYLLLLLSLPFAVLNLVRGQSVEYDLLNYHFYVPYAFLNGRLGVDIDPAHMQTYLNPIVDVPFYFFNHTLGLHAAFFGFLHGAFEGLTCFVYYKIFSVLYERSTGFSSKTPKALSLLVVVAFLSTATPLFLDILGTAFNDGAVSLFWLVAFYVFLKNGDSHRGLFIAGALAGLGAGVKNTYLIFLLPLFLYVPFVLKFRWRPSLALGTGVAFGFLIGGGWWAVFLYTKYGNPLFPMFNGLFPNPFMNDVNFSPRDANFTVEDWRDIFRMPIYLLNNTLGVIHHYHPFHDARMLMLVTLAVFTGVVFTIRAFKTTFKLAWIEIGSSSFAVFLGCFWILAYLLWYKTSMVYRYFMVGDQLLPLMCFGLISTLLVLTGRPKRWSLAAFCLVWSGLFLFQKTPVVSRFPWQQEFFHIRNKEALKTYADAMILMPALDNISYIAPFFPESTRFVRVQGSLDLFEMKSDRYKEQIARAVNEFSGPLYSVQLKFPKGDLNYSDKIMIKSKIVPVSVANSAADLYAKFGLKMTTDCRAIETIVHQFDDLTVCRLERRN